MASKSVVAGIHILHHQKTRTKPYCVPLLVVIVGVQEDAELPNVHCIYGRLTGGGGGGNGHFDAESEFFGLFWIFVMILGICHMG